MYDMSSLEHVDVLWCLLQTHGLLSLESHVLRPPSCDVLLNATWFRRVSTNARSSFHAPK